jgi:hypothetical protein
MNYCVYNIILTCPNSTAWLWTCISDLCSAARTSLLRLPFHFADHKKMPSAFDHDQFVLFKACDVGKSISSHNSKLACTHSLRWSATDCIAWIKLSLRPANMSTRAITKQKSYCFWLANVVTFKCSEAFYCPFKKRVKAQYHMLDVIYMSRAPNRGVWVEVLSHYQDGNTHYLFSWCFVPPKWTSVIMPNLFLVFDFLEKIGVVDENAYLLPFKVPLEKVFLMCP